MKKMNHEECINTISQLVSESSTLAVFFHTAIAEQAGLGATDEKTIFILRRDGPLTAGEIAQKTGLTTASVTTLIDRLEHKGIVKRMRDKSDRRKVIVQPNNARLAQLEQSFNKIQNSFESLLEGYSDTQLETIADFLSRTNEYSRQVLTELSK